LDGAAADVLQQRRIAQIADDLIVDAAGFGGVEQLRRHRLPVDPHRELAVRGPVRGSGRCRSPPPPRRSGCGRLVDLGGGDLVLDRDLDPVRADDELLVDQDRPRAAGVADRRLDDDHAVGPRRDRRQQRQHGQQGERDEGGVGDERAGRGDGPDLPTTGHGNLLGWRRASGSTEQRGPRGSAF
jgi:hypothetical protein